MAHNEVYLVAKDHEKHASACTSDELLLAILNANQRAVFDHDFTQVEKAAHDQRVHNEEVIKEIMTFKGVQYDDEHSQLQRKYSYYEPNREFTGKREDLKLKRIDDGTFIDNGYR